MTTITEYLNELRKLTDAAIDEAVRLCEPGSQWRMSIPADSKRDSDLLIIDALNNVPKLLDAVDKVLALCDEHARIEAHNESVPLNRISDLLAEPSSADYRAAVAEALGVSE